MTIAENLPLLAECERHGVAPFCLAHRAQLEKLLALGLVEKRKGHYHITDLGRAVLKEER